jgi:hypothetical protein
VLGFRVWEQRTVLLNGALHLNDGFRGDFCREDRAAGQRMIAWGMGGGGGMVQGLGFRV